MSKIAIKGASTGTGTFTIESPATNTDRTIDLPDAAGTVFVSGQALSATTGSFSGDVTLGSSVLATPSGSAPSYTCRAWVNFNGTGTVAIRASGNVSSITDNGTGEYTVNFTTALPDANYCVQGLSDWLDGTRLASIAVNASVPPTTSACRFVVADGTTRKDFEYVYAAIFR
jgi:hypothetical protein